MRMGIMPHEGHLITVVEMSRIPPLKALISTLQTSSRAISGIVMSRSSSCSPADSACHRDRNVYHFWFSGCKTCFGNTASYVVDRRRGLLDMSFICLPSLLLHLRLRCTFEPIPASIWPSRCRSCMPRAFSETK